VTGDEQLKLATMGRMARRTLLLAFEKFLAIDGTQRAAAFAYYTFFSLFPLLLLFVSVGSLFFERQVALEQVIGYAESYAPLAPEMKREVFDTIAGIVSARGQVGAVAFVALVWGALQFFKALIRATNRAWGTDMHNWWQMPLKSIVLLIALGSALVLGLTVPITLRIAAHWLPEYFFVSWTTNAATAIIPAIVLFYGLALFYRLAPRRRMRFAEIWPAALATSLLLLLIQRGFVLYLENFGKFNVVYGAFGGIMALLMWIYLSGCAILLGACACAAQHDITAGTDKR